jgi:hypothetical protein
MVTPLRHLPQDRGHYGTSPLRKKPYRGMNNPRTPLSNFYSSQD